MSYVSLAADAERMNLDLWHLPRQRRYKKTAAELRTDLIARLLGPCHPGFKGKLADIDAHVTQLVDCSLGRYGRALQIAINAYEATQRIAADLAKLTAKARPNRAEIAFLAADVRQWSAVSRAAYAIYRAARAAHGEDALSVFATGEPDCTKPWHIAVSVPAVTVDAEALLAASHEAVRVARFEADAAPRRPTLPVPEYEDCAPRLTVPQTLVAQLERFATKLETQSKEITAA